MIDMFLVRRETLLKSLPERCTKDCTLAKYIIAEFCRETDTKPYTLNTYAARNLLSKCIDGPMPVGTCGTEKIVCAHPSVDATIVSHEQPILFAEALNSL